MEINSLIVSLPAILALLFKGGIYAYARNAHLQNHHTRLYLFFLFALSIQNIAEIGHFHVLIDKQMIPTFEATVFYGASIAALAIIFQLALALAFDEYLERSLRLLSRFVYAYGMMLALLLFLTPWLISGFEPIGYSVTRIPGPLYPFFEVYAIGIALAVLGLMVYGALYQATPAKRAKASIMLVATVPMMLTVIGVLGLLHFGIKKVNASVTNPIALTYFLIVTAYAIHQHRLFEIRFYIPWSPVRKRKTVFYGRVRAMVAEIANLDSVETAVKRLADILRCPVALVGGHRPAVALAGATGFRVDLPDTMLRGLDRIVVCNEIAETLPEVHAEMKRHGIGAIVPFHPHSQYASGWLLLGDSFSEQVYTRLDFEVVEEVFDKMADLFLDKLVAMRAELADAFRQIRTLELREEATQDQLLFLTNEIERLTAANVWLRRRQPADSMSGEASWLRKGGAATLTMIGRDKERYKSLRRTFSQLVNYASVTSAGFRRQPHPDILLVRIDAHDRAEMNALARFLPLASASMALLLYGDGARLFVEENKGVLLGRLVELMEQDNEDQWSQRIEPMIELVKAMQAVPHPDHPLLGRSQSFIEQMEQANALAGLTDPLVIQTEDSEAAIALSLYIHEKAERCGEFRVLREADAESKEVSSIRWAEALVESVCGGTLMITEMDRFDNQAVRALFARLASEHDVRIICRCSEASGRTDIFAAPLRPFTLRMPHLRERKQDMVLLVHYFTLQFNLQSGLKRYLRQSELDELLSSNYPRTVLDLKHQVFDLLSQCAPRSAQENVSDITEAPLGTIDKTLDQHVCEFEARIIGETLRRCAGNKSKAARLLGLRPNTLHYKLERYRLNTGEKHS